MHFYILAGLFNLLGKQHGKAVGLIACRAAGNPDANLRLRLGAFHKRGYDLLLQSLPCMGLAEEIGHTNKQVFLQQADLFRVLVQIICVVLKRRNLREAHSPPDPPDKGAGLVTMEVMSYLCAQDVQDGAQVWINIRRFGLILADFRSRLLCQFHYRFGHIGRR
ncbi:MAG TPA: hypothetical protein VMT12_07510 [Syntrophales bacterium]|nr:hypothetical protein [Syntrophales bacterium]